MQRFFYITLSLFLVSTTTAIAQNVGIGTISPDSSAVLDITSTDKGILVPRMTAAQRQNIDDPALGLMVFDVTTGAFYYFNGMGWLEMLAGSVSVVTDSDNDTKIQVEESADEDVISFDMAGTEHFRMDHGRLEVLNTGGSVFLGKNAGLSDDLSDNNNVFIGNDAGKRDSTGASNVAIGYGAMLSNETGDRNVAIGKEALRQNVSADRNVAVGNSALQGSTGGNNIGIGYFTGLWQQAGSNNIFIGSQAGAGTESHTKSSNVFIGHQSGVSNVGNRNIFLGYLAGRDEVGSEKLYIENSGADSAHALIYGEFDNDLLRINGTVNINGAFSFPIVDGSLDQVLQTDGAGVVSWTDRTTNTDNQTLSLIDNNLAISGGNTIDISSIVAGIAAQTLTLTDDSLAISNGNVIDLSSINKVQSLIEDSDADTRIEVEESTDEDVIRFFTKGGQALSLSHDNHGNTLFDDLGSNKNNLIVGTNAGHNLTNEASHNVILGASAGRDLTSGSANTMVGRASGILNTVGNSNTYIGQLAGSQNVSGAANTFMGRSAGENNTGSGNIFIGYNAGKFVTGSGQLFIENSEADSASALIYGDFNTDWLRINGRLSPMLGITDADGDTKIQVEESANENVVRFDVAGSEVLTLTDSMSTFKGTGRDLLQIKTLNNTAETGLAFQNASSSYAWSIHRSAASIPDLVFSGGNTPSDVDQLTERMRITAEGNVVIAAGLSADTLTAGYTATDTISIGTSGTRLHAMIAQTVSKQVPFLPSDAEIFIDFTIPGATMTGVVHISPADELPDGIVIGQAYVSAPDTVSVKFVNYEAVGEIPFTLDYRIAVINY